MFDRLVNGLHQLLRSFQVLLQNPAMGTQSDNHIEIAPSDDLLDLFELKSQLSTRFC